VKFLTRAQLTAFRCYERIDIELDQVNVFVGPNNSGKSAVLRAIRRLASVDLNRHPRVADRDGVGFFASTSLLRLAPGDMRDGLDVSSMALDIGEDLPIPEGVERVARVHARFHPRRGTTLWADDEAEPQQPDKVNDRAEAMVRGLDALPIIVIPETRALPRTLALGYQQDDARFHEEMVDAGRVLPALVQWACEDATRIGAFVEMASDLLGETLTLTAAPGSSTFRIQVGQDAVRDVRDVGAGVVEILTLSAALTLHARGLLLYEEPELHLHPRIQRRIVAKLLDRARVGQWQVLLTTHSNHVLDHGMDEGVAVFAVTRSHDASRLERVVAGADRARVRAV
jgi:energy-coupling factor transporter ATP-binding protein EcfA2